jgi:hypothetical protein
MAKRKKAVHALEGAAAVGEAQAIVRRLIEDQEMRETVGRAIESSRRAYRRVTRTKNAAKLLEDKRLHADVAKAYEAIRTVTTELAGAAESVSVTKAAKRKRPLGRLLVLAGLGAGAAIATSEGLRSKVLDLLFGAEEEFEYSPPPATPSTDAPGSPLSAV